MSGTLTPGPITRTRARRGRRAGRLVIRVSWGTWETLSSPSCLPAGARLTNSRLIHSFPSRAVGTNRGRNDGIAKRRKRSAARWMARNHIVPLKRGNQPEGPRGGRGAPSHDPLKGNMPGTSRPESCRRNDDGSRRARTHETTSRVRVMCTPGCVGTLGEQSPEPPGLPDVITFNLPVNFERIMERIGQETKNRV